MRILLILKFRIATMLFENIILLVVSINSSLLKSPGCLKYKLYIPHPSGQQCEISMNVINHVDGSVILVIFE